MTKRDIPSEIAAEIFGYSPLKTKLNEQEQAELHGWVQDLVEDKGWIIKNRWFHGWVMGMVAGMLTTLFAGVLAFNVSFWGVDLKESNRLAAERNQIEALKSEPVQALMDGLLGDTCEIDIPAE